MNSERLDSIQALRGIAAVLVMLLHLSSLAIPGAFGVDIFFIISGFIMMYSTERGSDGFAVKRAIRILPLYVVATLAQYGLNLIMYLITRSGYYLGLLSFKFLMQSLLFDRSVDPIILSGWTLNLEIVFYAVFGIACALSHKHRASVCAALIILFVDRNLFLEFIMGMGAFYALRYIEKKVEVTALTKILCAVLCAMLMAYFFWTSKLDGFNPSVLRPYRWGIPALLFVCCFCIATRGRKLPRWLVSAGDMSYSIYLWHVPVLFVVREMAGIGSIIVRASIALILTLAVSHFSYVFIELRLTSYLRKKFIATNN